MELPGGAYASIGNYGYGYNGMEKDDELKGSGKTYTTKFRQASTVEGFETYAIRLYKKKDCLIRQSL